MTAVRLHEVDTTSLVANQTHNPNRLSELGVKSARLMGGMALTTVRNDPVARERNAREGTPDNPNLLLCLRQAGVPVGSYKDFRQLETTIRTPRTGSGLRALLDFARGCIDEIARQHRVDARSKLGGAGLQLTLITDAGGDQLLGFLGHNDSGDRIFLSRDGEMARVWFG